MKILILGTTGMLGHDVYTHLKENNNFDVIGTYRRKINGFPIYDQIEFDPLKQSISDLPKVDYIINCIGIIKPFIEDNIIESIFINSSFPHLLADYCNAFNIKLIHITTDCVFSGSTGNYTEKSLHDCEDIYGKTKSLGEPINKAMVLRTSIIGEEIHKNASLISWAKSMKGKTVNGFTNHIWNGISTKRYAIECEEIISHNHYKIGLFHLYSDIFTKYKLLQIINEIFKLDLNIIPTEAPTVINRTLYTLHQPNY